MQTLPQEVKWSLDSVAIGTAFTHWWGIWEGHVAAVASTAALIWIAIQAFYYLKDRWTK